MSGLWRHVKNKVIEQVVDWKEDKIEFMHNFDMIKHKSTLRKLHSDPNTARTKSDWGIEVIHAQQSPQLDLTQSSLYRDK